jgi:hypothetical protein
MKIIGIVLMLLTVLPVCAMEFEVGDRIIDQYGNTGKIECLFSNNTAEIHLDNFPRVSYVRRLATLGRAFCCIESVCIGKKIVDQYGNIGSIVELFHNGMANIKLKGQHGYFSRSLTTLGIGLECLNNESCRYTPIID